jgi:hypothetical protein
VTASWLGSNLLALPEELVHGQLAADLDRRRAWYELLAG